MNAWASVFFWDQLVIQSSVRQESEITSNTVEEARAEASQTTQENPLETSKSETMAASIIEISHYKNKAKAESCKPEFSRNQIIM